MTLQDRKRMRTHWFLEKLNSQGVAGLGYPQEKLLAEFCLFFGASMRVAPDYLKELESAERIVIKDGSVYSRRFFDAKANIREEVFAPEEPEDEAEKEMDKIIKNQKGVKQSGN